MSPFFLPRHCRRYFGSRRGKPGFAGERSFSITVWTLESPDGYVALISHALGGIAKVSWRAIAASTDRAWIRGPAMPMA